MHKYIILTFLFISLLLQNVMMAQPSVFVSEAELREAELKFSKQDYAGALPVYLIDERRKTNDALLKYKIGICYFNSTSQKLKATEYFEFALKNKNEKIPDEVYYYLGKCYHYSYQFIAAINMFNTYLESYQNKKPLFSDAAKMIMICENAAKLYSTPINNVSVSPLDVPVNTSYDDYAAYTSGNNGNYLIFSSSRRKDSFNFVFGNDYVYLPDELKSKSEDIYMAYRRGIGWTHPYPAELDGKVCYPLSITNDGKEMILYKGEDEINGDIYIASVKKSRWGNLRKLSPRINSRFSEKGACFAGNNKIIYFASNRPGGFGGYDIYKSYQIGKEEWSEPINLGASVNSEADEIYPFMHPDNKTLYFSSNGRNTMGGFDIFYTISEGAGWKEPINLGFPINSTFDEICFFQGNDRKYSYVSSNRITDESLGGYDVIRIFRPEKKVPRTMITGKILALKSGVSLPLTLKVKDIDSGEPQQYIYNPDLESGRFFMILAPKKNYQIAIYYEGVEVNTLNINVPADTYNYELNHEMDITPIDLLGTPVGETITVRNTDSKITKLQDLPSQDSVKDNRYDALLLLMEMIIDRKDVQGLANLNELEKPIKEAFLVDTRGNRRGDVDEYYTPLIELVEKALLNADTSFLEKLENAQSLKQHSTILFEDKSNIDKSKKLIKRHSIWFRDTQTDLESKQKGELLQIVDFLKNQPSVKVEVMWFTSKSETGIALNNEELGQKRASVICDFLKSNDITSKRFTTTHKELFSNQNDTQKLEVLLYESL